jgi:hypothetical protein
MDPITLIVAALAAGAVSGALDGLKDDVKGPAKAAYEKFRGLVKKRVSRIPSAELALTEYESDPKTWEAPLAAKLKEVSADDDAELLAAAKALMEVIDEVGTGSGKYKVRIEDSKGVQVGDGNIQVNTF